MFGIGTALASQSNMAGALMVLLGVGVGLVSMGVMIWLAVRLSMVVPASIDLNSFAFAEVWKASRGHFGPLFGTAILTFLVVMAVSILWIVLAALVVIGVVLVAMMAGMFSPGAEVG